MKIKVYIVTYKKNDLLNKNLASLWQSIKGKSDISVTILANHPDVVINDENKRDNLRVILNATRMPHAWGYLSRDWNFCILDAFKTWENDEDVDWCVLAQNDLEWVEGWDYWLETNDKYDFVSQPFGDQAIALNIDCVKKTGFFEERLTTLHFQEIDYFIRTILYMKDRTSINDEHKKHDYTVNPVGNVLTKTAASGFDENDQCMHNSKNWQTSFNFISKKWGVESILNMKLVDIVENVEFFIFKDNEINWYPFFWDGFDNKSFNKIVVTNGDDVLLQLDKNQKNIQVSNDRKIISDKIEDINDKQQQIVANINNINLLLNQQGELLNYIKKHSINYFIRRFVCLFIPSKNLRKKIRG